MWAQDSNGNLYCVAHKPFLMVLELVFLPADVWQLHCRMLFRNLHDSVANESLHVTAACANNTLTANTRMATYCCCRPTATDS